MNTHAGITNIDIKNKTKVNSCSCKYQYFTISNTESLNVADTKSSQNREMRRKTIKKRLQSLFLEPCLYET